MGYLLLALQKKIIHQDLTCPIQLFGFLEAVMVKKNVMIFLVCTLLLFVLCTSSPKKTFVVITFDVEDYISPDSEGIDDISKWIAEIMSEEGVTGTFFVIGEKARSLEKRGRFDVIQAMAEHEIGSHTNFGSIHPTVTEQLEMAGWEDGVVQMMRQESAGFGELHRIFDKPIVTLARHGGSYGPQLIHALGQLDAAYVGSPIRLPGKNIVWFCNALNFYGQYSGFDNTYFRDDLFEPVLDSLKVQFPAVLDENDFISVFACHPCKVRTEQFWDLNFYEGVNPDSSQWKYPDLRPLESMKTARKNFRRLMRFLGDQEGVEITSFHNLMELYGNQREFIKSKDINVLAERIIKEDAIVGDDFFSPAELFAALVESIVEFKKTDSSPPRVKRISPLGPMETATTVPELSSLSVEEVYQLAQTASDYINRNGALPSVIKMNDLSVGTGSMLALFSQVYLDMTLKRILSEYSVIPFESYPKRNEEAILEEIRSYANWPVHRKDLDMNLLVEITKNQLWTLKPAIIM